MSLAESIPKKLQTNIDNIIDNVPPNPWLTEAEKKSYTDKIKVLLKQKDAVVIAHYYVDALIQELAEQSDGFIGDSLEMARFGKHLSLKIEQKSVLPRFQAILASGFSEWPAIL